VAPGSHAEVDIDIENTGRSPAQKVEARTATAFVPRDWLIPDQPPSPVEIDVGAIGPGQAQSVPFRKPDALTPTNIDALNAGTWRLYFFGNVTYSDQFSSDRELKFCLYYQPPTVTSLGSCSTHNSVR